MLKKGLKKTTKGSIKSRIAKVLFAYRNTPHCTTGNSKAKLLLGRQFRTRLDLLRPNTAEHVEKKQWDQKLSHGSSVKSQTFAKGQSVLILILRHSDDTILCNIVFCIICSLGNSESQLIPG